MHWKNRLLLGLVSLLKKKEQSSSLKKFLIVSTTALGDTLWATPSLYSLKKSFPASSISVLTSPLGFSVLENNPDVDSFFIYRNIRNLFSLFFRLRKENFTTIVFFHTSQRVILPLCATLGAKELIGNQGFYKGLESLLTHSVSQKSCHEIERRLELIRLIGAEVHTRKMRFFPQVADRAQASEWLKLRGINEDDLVIGLHPGASNPFKKWPIECYATLAKHLLKKGYKVVFTGSENELKVAAHMVPTAHVTVPALSLGTLGALIERFALYICNDTGPMHIAVAMQTKVLCLFAPTDSRLCGPIEGSDAKVIQKGKTCIPCIGKKCQTPFCLLQISTQEVIQEAEKLLQNKRELSAVKEVLPNIP